MAVMPVTEMAAYEDDDTRLEFDVESDLPRFLSSILQRGSVHFANPQSMDYLDGLPKWTDYLNGLLNGLPKWTTLNYLP